MAARVVVLKNCGSRVGKGGRGFTGLVMHDPWFKLGTGGGIVVDPRQLIRGPPTARHSFGSVLA